MASAKNKVIAGAYNGYVVQHSSKDIFLCPSTFSMDMTRLNKQTVDSYDLITEDKVKSGSSAILRGGSWSSCSWSGRATCWSVCEE